MSRTSGVYRIGASSLRACTSSGGGSTEPLVGGEPETTSVQPTATRSTHTPRPPTRDTTPTPTAAPKVGLQAACTLYVSSDLPTRSVEPITEFVAHPDGSTLDLEETAAIAEELRTLAARSPVEFGVQLGTMAGVLEDMVDAFKSGVNQTIKTGDFKAASIDVIFQCGDAIGS